MGQTLLSLNQATARSPDGLKNVSYSKVRKNLKVAKRP